MADVDPDYAMIYWRDALRVLRAGAVHVAGDEAQTHSIVEGARAVELEPLTLNHGAVSSLADWCFELGVALEVPSPSASLDWLIEHVGHLSWIEGNNGLVIIQSGLDPLTAGDPDALLWIGEIAAISIERHMSGVLFEGMGVKPWGRVIHWVVVGNEELQGGIVRGVERHNARVLEMDPGWNWRWWRTLPGGEDDLRWKDQESVPADEWVVHASPHGIIVPVAIHPASAIAFPPWRRGSTSPS